MKRLCSVVLSVVLALTLVVPAFAVEAEAFTDIEGHWAAASIEKWHGLGVVQGGKGRSFRPDDSMTRAELSEVLDKLMGFAESEKAPFTDVPDGAWYKDVVNRAAAAGIVNGYGNGTVRPTEAVSRQEAAVMLCKTFGVAYNETAAAFADWQDVSSWAQGAVSALNARGVVVGDKTGFHPRQPVTRAQLVSMLDRMLAQTVTESGTVSGDVAGSLLVSAADVRLENMTIGGDLIIADAVGNGDVYASNVKVGGNIILRGCGENSFHLLGDFEVTGKLIVTKTTKGGIRVVNESGKTIPVVYVNDGAAGVTITGNVGTVVVACDVPVLLKDATVGTVSVASENAKVTVAEDSRVSRLDVNANADGTTLNVEGRVTNLVLNTGTTVNNSGVISHITRAPGVPEPRDVDGNIVSEAGGFISGGTGGSGSGSSGGEEPPVTEEKTEIKNVSLQLLAPAFGNIPDTADVLDAGYSATTVWQNADGSAPTYRWKADASQQDVFAANQAYQAIVTLTPGTGYVFAENVAVTITDGKTLATSYNPYSVNKNGDKLVVTVKYPATEQVDAITSVQVSGASAVKKGETTELAAVAQHNSLMDPAGFAYQWYSCDADGKNAVAISGATGAKYTVPATATAAEGTLYYLCRVSAMGKTFASGVFSVQVQDILDISTVPVPVINSVGITYLEHYSCSCVDVSLSNLVSHPDLTYYLAAEFKGTVCYKNGTTKAFTEDWHGCVSGHIYSGSYSMLYQWMFDIDTILEEGTFAEKDIVSVRFDEVGFTVTAEYKDKAIDEKTAHTTFAPDAPIWELYIATDLTANGLPSNVQEYAPTGKGTLTIDAETGLARFTTPASSSDWLDCSRCYLLEINYYGNKAFRSSASISFDENGVPSWQYDISDFLSEISNPETIVNIYYSCVVYSNERVSRIYYGALECEIVMSGGNG